MNPTAKRLYRHFILSRPIFTVSVLLVLVGLFAVYARDFRMDATSEALLLEDDEDMSFLVQVEERYREDPFLFITYTPHDGDLFVEEILDRLSRLRAELRAIERVKAVTTVLDVPLLKNPPAPLRQLVENLKTLDSGEADLDLARQEFKTSPIYQNLLVSADLRSTAIQLTFERDDAAETLYLRRGELIRQRSAEGLTETEKEELRQVSEEYSRRIGRQQAEFREDLREIRRILQPYREHATIHLGGVPTLQNDVVRYIRNDLRIFGLGMLAFLLLVLGGIFHRVRWVVLPLACCVASVTVMMGILGLTGWEVTVVSSNFISLQLVFTLSLTIHQIVRYRELLLHDPGIEHRSLIRQAVELTFVPCLYSVMTTMAGFISLLVSGIRPVVQFGYMMTLGLAVTLVMTFLLYPAGLCLTARYQPKGRPEFGRFITRFFARLTEHRRGWILAFSVAVGLATAGGMMRLEVENSFIDYFRERTEVHQGMFFIDRVMGGTTPLNVLIRFSRAEESRDLPEDEAEIADFDDFADFGDFGDFEDAADETKYWFTTIKMEQIDRVHRYLESLDAIGKVMSLATLWRVGEELNSGEPLDNFMAQILFHQMPEDFQEILVHPYASPEHDEARIAARIIDTYPGLSREQLISRIRHDLEHELGLAPEEFRLSGLLIVYNNVLQSLFSSLVETAGLTVLALLLMFLVLFRSWTIAVIAMLPNLLASLTVLGVMGWMSIPLDIMTITIVAISMGIAVDNTIHYLHRFRREFASDRHYLRTMRHCHGSIGNAMFYTSFTIMVGFSILAFSNFVPSVFFGVLTALAIMMALIAALSLLPALILILRPFGAEAAAGGRRRLKRWRLEV